MKKYLWPTITVVCLFIGFLIGNAIQNKANAQRIVINGNEIFAMPNSKVDQLLHLLEQQYVDSLNVDSITDEVMADIVKQLDPHSAYIPKKDLEMVNSELSASFSGIGVQFTIQKDTINVVAVISGGSSEGVGVLAGDKIISVNDTNFTGKGINNEKVMHTLRGPKGTQVKIGVLRHGCPDTLYYTITRGDIPIKSVDAYFIIDKNIGFVRVNKFGESTYNEFISALADLKKDGATSYIIDLRENSGGYMDQAIRMANEFLNAGEMIVYSHGRAYPRYEAKANGLGRFKQVPLVVLIDNFSASASEIFAGAMQDNDRAMVIGRRSFGKGLVQQQMPFMDGSAIRLTVARYYTPSGRCIQRPYELGKQDQYAQDIIDRYEKGEFFSEDSIHFGDSTRYYTKNGRVVLGGGGIMPDIFVARDTSLMTPYYNKVVNLAFTYQFAYQYVDEYRQQLSQFKTWQSLEQHLIKQDLLPQFVAFCKDKDVQPKEDQIAKSSPLLKRLIHCYIVRDVLGDDGFFPLFEREDEITKKAVEVLQASQNR